MITVCVCGMTNVFVYLNLILYTNPCMIQISVLYIIERKAGSGDFWKCVRAADLTNKSRRRVNLEEVYDQQVGSQPRRMLWRYGGLTLRHCWVVKLSRMKQTLVVNVRLYSQQYVVEMEDCDHWLLRCSRWDIERHLLTNVQQRLPNFASVSDDMQRSAAITDLACEDRRTVQLIYSMWTARFG